MTYLIEIRRNSDGVIKRYTSSEEWSDESTGWWWTEGNGACDCNREWYFQRAAGEPLSPDPACGDTRYTVLRAIFPDGREIALEG